MSGSLYTIASYSKTITYINILISSHLSLSLSLSLSLYIYIYIYVYTTGEAWSNVGSRKFVDDLTFFTCSDPASATSSDSCTKPYKPSLAFLDLDISKVSRVLELNQVGLNSSCM